MKNVLSRRALLATAGGVPLFARASAPSGRVRVGMIGVGRQTVFVNLKQFLSMPEVAAVCDVDRWRLENGKRQVEEGAGRKAGQGLSRLQGTACG